MTRPKKTQSDQVAEAHQQPAPPGDDAGGVEQGVCQVELGCRHHGNAQPLQPQPALHRKGESGTQRNQLGEIGRDDEEEQRRKSTANAVADGGAQIVQGDRCAKNDDGRLDDVADKGEKFGETHVQQSAGALPPGITKDRQPVLPVP